MASTLHRRVLTEKYFDVPVMASGAKTASANVSHDRSCADLIHDLQEQVSVIDTRFFFDHLLPPSPLTGQQTLEGVVEDMKAAGKIEDAYWADWERPSATEGKEDNVFKKLEGLTKAIQRAAGFNGKTTTVEFICNGAISLGCRTRSNSSKPDCYAIRNPKVARARFVKDRSGKRQPLWLDVAVPGEFKKTHTTDTFNDNAMKVLWSMHHIMREDARRRFIIGFSIDDTSMRLWYFSRSDAYVSEPFDFLEDHGLVIDFVLRVSCANLEQLGWDPTITLRPRRDGHPIEYDIQVAEEVNETVSIRTFRTVRVLSNLGAETLRGRGTRVWEVAELDDSGNIKPGPTVVLKDSWVDDDREREGKIMADIRQAAKSEGRTAIEQYLLTVVTFGDVQIHDEVDKTRRWPQPVIKGQLEVKIGPRDTGRLTSGENLGVVGSIAVDAGTQPTVVDQFSTKVRHRIVFKEVGKTIKEVTSLKEGFLCLCGAIYALRILHLLGWVHRDISCGNMLIANGMVKLTDFEYAKREDDTRPHGVRTGTKYFMAVEVDRHRYAYRTVENAPVEAQSDDEDWDERDLQLKTRFDGTARGNTHDGEDTLPVLVPSTSANDPSPAMVPVPFKHNPLHDLESIFWLGMYILLVGRLVSDGGNPPTPSTLLATQTEAQKDFAFHLFCNDQFRRDMGYPGALEEELGKIILNERVRSIAGHLDGVLKILIAAYTKAETNLRAPVPFDIASELKVYRDIVRCFDKINLILQDSDITIAIDDASACQLRGDDKSNEATALDDDDAGDDDGNNPRPKKKQRSSRGSPSTSSREQPSGSRRSSRLAHKYDSTSAP